MRASNRVSIPDWLKNTGTSVSSYHSAGKSKGFIEKNINAIASFIKEVLEPEGFAQKNGLLQLIDPRARLFGILSLIITAAILKSTMLLSGFLVLVIILSFASKLPFWILLKRTLPVLVFTFFLVLPIMFNFITPGAALVELFNSDGFDLYISKQGLEGIVKFLLRVGAMISLLSLFTLTTNYPDVFRALQSFPVPRIFIAALSMTFKYIMVLIKVAEDSHLAKKARIIRASTMKESQGWLASRIWLIMERSLETAESIYLAMTARGFSGEVKTMTAFKMKGRDYAWMGFAIFIFLLSVQL